MKKPKWTLEQHIATGKALKKMRQELLAISYEAGVYGKSAKLNRALHKTLEHLGTFKSELENQYCRDYPVEFTVNTYYGPLEEPEPVRFPTAAALRPKDVAM